MAAALIAAAPAMALLPRGSVRFVDVPVVTMPIATSDLPTLAPPARTALRRMPMLALPEPESGDGPPAEIDPHLLEHATIGDLPRTDSRGRTPLHHYARPATADCRRPCVAVLITGLGLTNKLTARALKLPGAIGLSFSPYTGAAAWQARARASGHEALLMLPLQPEHFPLDDAGPLALPVSAPPNALADALARVLAAGSGYVALDTTAGAFAHSAASLAPVAEQLAARGLGLIEIGGDALAAQARQVGLAYLGRAMAVDLDPIPAAIDAALAGVVAEARASGRAMAVAQPLPASFDLVTAWIATLPGQGIALVPPSLLLSGTGADAVATRH